MAAITDIVMVIPQAMGYALVAGLPPINGLYSALMGHCLYSPFGSSGQLIVAPVAIVSLMTKETLEHYFHDADPSIPEVGRKMAAYGSALAFQSGVICLLLGFCKAGVLANMLAEPVIVGFCFAAAILIGISQLTFVFQIHVHGENVVEKLITFFSEIGQLRAREELHAQQENDANDGEPDAQSVRVPDLAEEGDQLLHHVLAVHVDLEHERQLRNANQNRRREAEAHDDRLGEHIRL